MSEKLKQVLLICAVLNVIGTASGAVISAILLSPWFFFWLALCLWNANTVRTL